MQRHWNQSQGYYNMCIIKDVIEICIRSADD